MATGPTQNYTDASATTWRARPVLAAAVRAGVTLGPVLFALLVGAGAAWWAPATRIGVPAPVWLLLVVGVSSAVLFACSRWLRRLLPLSALLRLSLVLPDRVPSRFEVARRTWSPCALEPVRDPAGGGAGGGASWLLTLVGTLAEHDARTRAHGERVQAYAALVGRELGLPAEDVERLSWVALLHDVGKVHVPVEIINKDGRPSEEEWATLQQHPHHGGELVQPLRGWLGDWLDGVEQHHERWDGGGYPRGLAGEDVSLAARIIAVADTYDVITSARAYKKPMSAAQARAEITRCAGKQFDPEVVRAFLSVGVGRLRVVAGPATLLAALPGVGAAPAQALSTVSSVAQTAGGHVAVAVLSAGVGVGGGLTATQVLTTPVDTAVGTVAASAPATPGPAADLPARAGGAPTPGTPDPAATVVLGATSPEPPQVTPQETGGPVAVEAAAELSEGTAVALPAGIPAPVPASAPEGAEEAPKVEKAPKVERTEKAPKVEEAPKAEKAPKAETEKAPKAEKAPEVEKAPKVEDAPEVKTEKAPKVEVEKAPKVEVEKAPKAEVEKAPKAEVEKAPKAQKAN